MQLLHCNMFTEHVVQHINLHFFLELVRTSTDSNYASSLTANLFDLSRGQKIAFRCGVLSLESLFESEMVSNQMHKWRGLREGLAG